MTKNNFLEKKKRSVFQFSKSIDLESIDASGIPKKRTCTDFPFIIIFVIFFILLIPLSAICSEGTDMKRFLYGNDNCGNTCGKNNSLIHGINCSGQDMTDKQVSLMEYQNKKWSFTENRILATKCVRCCCLPNRLIFHRCYPPETAPVDSDSSNLKQIYEILHILDKSLSNIIIMSVTGLVLSYVMLICLRCQVIVTFWTIIIFQLIICTTVTTLFWYRYITSKDLEFINLIFALMSTGYLGFLILFTALFRNRFELILSLYEEAIKAIFRIPMLLIQPLLTLCVLIAFGLSMVFLLFLISSNGRLVLTDPDLNTLEYVPKICVLLFALYVAVMMIWMFAFVDGCQCMIVSGVITSYYFSRNKSSLTSLYRNSFLTLMRYHLGSVAHGSFIVILIPFLRGVVEYVIGKAYIQTAMHGTSLWKSGICAAKVLSSNFVNTAVLAGLNFIVINGFSLVAVMLSMVVGVLINSNCIYSDNFWIGLLFGLLSTSFITYFVVQVINIATDTTYMCFCEDRILNDGKNRPYYMNSKLLALLDLPKPKNHDSVSS